MRRSVQRSSGGRPPNYRSARERDLAGCEQTYPGAFVQVVVVRWWRCGSFSTRGTYTGQGPQARPLLLTPRAAPSRDPYFARAYAPSRSSLLLCFSSLSSPPSPPADMDFRLFCLHRPSEARPWLRRRLRIRISSLELSVHRDEAGQVITTRRAHLVESFSEV